MEEQSRAKIRCLIVPLTLVVTLPFLITPAAFLPWILRSNQSKASVKLEIDLLSSLKSLQTYLNGSNFDKRFRPSSSTTEPRNLRRSFNVWQNETSSPHLETNRSFESYPEDRVLLLRPVSRNLRGNSDTLVDEGSGDAPSGRVHAEVRRIGEEESSNISNHR